MNNHELWNNFLEIIKTRIAPISYDTWFKDTSLVKIHNNKCIIRVPMEFSKDFLNNKYYDLIVEILSSITNITYDLEFAVEEDLEINTENESLESKHRRINSNLNEKYTFDSYVTGESNIFAQTTALAVAESPGKIYNPLFIYGKSGLGKTHLMHAIGNHIQSTSNKVVLYVTSGEFIDDYTSIYKREKNVDNFEVMNNFRDKYRNVDVLMIDDIQFLAGASKSQEEFFNIFTFLHDSDKQIIISSDRSPDDLKILEERLLTRFRWGLTVNIYPPDFELRCKILKNKVMSHEVASIVSNDVVEYIASNCESDVRQLEGAITRLYAYASMMVPKEINLEFAREALNDYLTKSIYITNNIQKIQKAVADYYKITIDDLKSKKRTENINYPRQIAMYLCRMTTEETIIKIGLEFGNRNHATVLHSCEKIAEELKTNSTLRETLEKIKNKIVN